MNLIDVESIAKDMYSLHVGPMDKTFEMANLILAKEDRLYFIKYLVEHFDYRFNINFLLWSPQFWKDFYLQYWANLMAQIDNRPLFNYNLYDTGHYDDLRFLNIYIGIFPFKMFFENPKISLKEKIATKDFILSFSFFFTHAEKYLDGLDEILPYDFKDFAFKYKQEKIGLYESPIYDQQDLIKLVENYCF